LRGAAKNARHSKKEPRKRRSGMPAKGARIGRIGAPSRSHVRGAKRGKAAQWAGKGREKGRDKSGGRSPVVKPMPRAQDISSWPQQARFGLSWPLGFGDGDRPL